ncbi:hypothetical protein ACU3L3_09120 [Priestia endophytica]|nr:hypothetical protein [Priestia endophytica]
MVRAVSAAVRTSRYDFYHDNNRRKKHEKYERYQKETKTKEAIFVEHL